jgi:hypothetical protein
MKQVATGHESGTVWRPRQSIGRGILRRQLIIEAQIAGLVDFAVTVPENNSES